MAITITITQQLTKTGSLKYDNSYDNLLANRGGGSNLDLFGDFIRLWMLSRTQLAIPFETNCHLDDDDDDDDRHHHHHNHGQAHHHCDNFDDHEVAQVSSEGQFWRKISKMQQNLLLVLQTLPNHHNLILNNHHHDDHCTHNHDDQDEVAPLANSAKWFRLFFTAAQLAPTELEPELFLPTASIVLQTPQLWSRLFLIAAPNQLEPELLEQLILQEQLSYMPMIKDLRTKLTYASIRCHHKHWSVISDLDFTLRGVINDHPPQS